VESIALDPTDANRVYLAAGMYLHWSPISAAILISGNRGKTFQRSQSALHDGGNDTGQQTGERLVVNPFNPAQLYLATHLNGLWQSLDYGASWGQAATFPILSSSRRGGAVLCPLRSAEDGTVYVGAYSGGIYRSTDGGATWVHSARPARTLAGWRDAPAYAQRSRRRWSILRELRERRSAQRHHQRGRLQIHPGDGTWTTSLPGIRRESPATDSSGWRRTRSARAR